MGNLIVFYHFSTKDSLDSSDINSSDIAFCSETKTIFTNSKEYLSFNWSEIPSINESITVSSGKLIINDDSAFIEGNVCVFTNPDYTVSDSTLIIS